MLPAWRKRLSGAVRSADFRVGLARTKKTSRTTLAQRQPKAGLETSAPPERWHVAGFAQTNEWSGAERRLPSRLSANDENEPDDPCSAPAQSRFGNQRSAGAPACCRLGAIE